MTGVVDSLYFYFRPFPDDYDIGRLISLFVRLASASIRLKCIKCVTDTAFGWYTGERISWFMMPSRTRGMGDMLLTHLEMKYSLAHCNANSIRVVHFPVWRVLGSSFIMRIHGCC